MAGNPELPPESGRGMTRERLLKNSALAAAAASVGVGLGGWIPSAASAKSLAAGWGGVDIAGVKPGRKLGVLHGILSSTTDGRVQTQLNKIRAQIGWTYVVSDANNDLTKYPALAQTMITDKVDAIFVISGSIKALGSDVMNSARQKHIPIVGMWTDPRDEPDHTIGVSEWLAFARVCEYVSQAINYKGQVAIVNNEPGNAALAQRSVIAEAVFGFYAPDIQIVAKNMNINFSDIRIDTLRKVQPLLIKYPNLKALVCGWDDPARAAGDAVKAAGRQNSVIVTGDDGSLEMFDAMRRNKALALTVGNDIELMTLAGVQVIDDLCRGKKLWPVTYIDSQIVSHLNLPKPGSYVHGQVLDLHLGQSL